MEVALLFPEPDEPTSRSEVIAFVAAAWLRAQSVPLCTRDQLATSIEHLITHFLGSGPGNRGGTPPGASGVLKRAGIEASIAAACRSFRKADPIAGEYAVAFASLALELAPLAAAIQTSRTPCQERARELLIGAGLFQDSCHRDAPVNLTMVKDRVVSALTPFAIDEYVARPGLTAGEYRTRIIGTHVPAVGALVFKKLVAATEKRLPAEAERDLVDRFEAVWDSTQRERLLASAARVVGNPHDAEDAVQDAAVRILEWVRNHPGREPRNPAGFTHTTVANVAKSARGSASSRHEVPLAAGVDPTCGNDDFGWVEALISLRAAAVRASRRLRAGVEREDQLAAVVIAARFLVVRDLQTELGWHDLNEVQLRRDLETIARPICASRAEAGRLARRVLREIGAELRGECA